MFYHKCFDMRQSFNKFKNLNCVGKERINRAFCIHSNILIRQRGASIFLFLILVENQKLRLVPTLWCNFVCPTRGLGTDFIQLGIIFPSDMNIRPRTIVRVLEPLVQTMEKTKIILLPSCCHQMLLIIPEVWDEN